MGLVQMANRVPHFLLIIPGTRDRLGPPPGLETVEYLELSLSELPVFPAEDLPIPELLGLPIPDGSEGRVFLGLQVVQDFAQDVPSDPECLDIGPYWPDVWLSRG